VSNSNFQSPHPALKIGSDLPGSTKPIQARSPKDRNARRNNGEMEAKRDLYRLGLPRFGEFNFDAQFDFRQNGIETGIAGGRFKVNRSLAQAVHGR
jgi:hypothetical protein